MREKPKILIVDDNLNNIYVIEQLLAGYEAELVEAHSGSEAVDLTDQQEFALVLMDVSMPGMDGFEAAALIKQHEQNSLLNIIFVTALLDEPYNHLKGVNAGGIDFISKPLVPELFRGKVNIFLNLYKQRKNLETEIKNRVVIEQELIRARTLAEEAAQAKQSFLSTMSHEIRTPLNAIINTTHLLYEDKPRDDQMDNMETLMFSAESLLHLINEILDYSKIDAGKIEFESQDFELRKLISEIQQSLEHEAAHKNLELNIQIDPAVPAIVRGDSARLSQVLLNLIGNAIKFTPQGTVSLAIKPVGIQGDSTELLFSVADTGIGIQQEKQEKIFESFTQANPSVNRTYGGTGLGLAIARMLVDLQGGRIWLESKVGQGSTFFFTLSFLKGTSEHVATDDVARLEFHSLKGIRVLVAEDNTVNRKIVANILSKWEASPDLAENGIVAVEKIRNNHYNLVLMDINMPEMNGYEATMTVRRMNGEYFRNLPILALTATAFTEDRNKFQSYGLNGYIIKPFTPPQLYNKIAHYLR